MQFACEAKCSMIFKFHPLGNVCLWATLHNRETAQECQHFPPDYGHLKRVPKII